MCQDYDYLLSCDSGDSAMHAPCLAVQVVRLELQVERLS